MKHETYQRASNMGLLWVIRTREPSTGHAYLFRYAYPERPADSILHNLTTSRLWSNPALNLGANYIRDTAADMIVGARTTSPNRYILEA